MHVDKPDLKRPHHSSSSSADEPGNPRKLPAMETSRPGDLPEPETQDLGTSETRLDRFYVSEGLVPVVADVAAGSFPPESGRISDHYPVILSMALPDRRLEGKRFWKLDLAVLADDESKDILRAGINRTLTNARNPSLEWDALKSQWAHRHVTGRRRDTIFRDAPELTRFLRSRRSPDGPSSYVMSVSMPDGSVSECVADIDRRFSEYFADLFTEGDMAADSDALNKELEGLCATVSKLPAAASESLLKTVSAAEVFSILRSMKVGSAPGPDGLPTDRLKHWWPDVICTQQVGSVAGRNIFNALTLTRDLLAYMDHTKTPGLCVLHRAVFSFFWDGSTERLQRDALRLPRCFGGYGLPCIGTMAQLLALRTVLGILDDVGAPARPLAMFFLGPLRRTIVPRALGNLYPSAVNTPAYYRALVALSRELTALDSDLNPREVPPARLCEQLVSARTTLNSPPPTFPWLELTSGRLPKEAADLQWRRASRILPTLDRLQRWGTVQYARCPNCGSTETAAQAVSTCVVARTFWRLVHRSMPSLRVANYYTRDRWPREALGRLAVSAGARTMATRGAAAEVAEKAKAEVTSTNPQCDKSSGGRRVSSLKAAALTGEAPLKELDPTDSSDPDSGRKRLHSLTQGSPAVSRERQQRRRRAEPARKTPANPACGAKKAAAFKGSEKDEKNKAEDAVEAWQPDSEEGYASHEKEQPQSSKKEERATTNRGSKATSLTTVGKNKNDQRLFFSQWGDV
ncbi:hypothetical protein HPB52_008335 [Rhipicephalus sanguineus]|uniref:Reverse transcriptase domain-containing protein n=1 Tax=Rhipicephalus sanguineus TaxID=34632 RepID=A0A9D4PF18_RHISA|nr:hypothetical protein HPB52_008335 [Rhipicephalus sanguineus]